MGGGFLGLGFFCLVPRVPGRVLLLSACLWLAAAGSSSANLIINEVLYDPEGPDDGLEFVELFNPTDETVSLNCMVLETGNGAGAGDWGLAVEWTDHVYIEPGRFFVVGERAVTPPPDWVCDLDLQNGPDACRLTYGESVLDLVGWGAHTFPEYYEGAPCEDAASGSSVARIPDGADSQDNAADFRPVSPPTPGRRNMCEVDAGLVAGSLSVSPPLPAAYEQAEVSVESEPRAD
jgi:hypothetical protein